MRIALDGAPLAIVTEATLELPRAPGIGLAIVKRREPAILDALLGEASVPTGDPRFDEAFLVRGGVGAQRLLGERGTRQAIDDLGRAAIGFQLDEARLVARWAGAIARSEELARVDAAVERVRAGMFGGEDGRGPYR